MNKTKINFNIPKLSKKTIKFKLILKIIGYY